MITKVSRACGRWGAILGLIGLAGLVGGCHSGRAGATTEFTDLGGGTGTVAATPAGTPADPATGQPTLPATSRSDNPETLQVGDSLTISFTDTPAQIPPFQERVKEDGTITLVYNKVFVAAGKSRGDLEKEIRAAYVPSFFTQMTVIIKTEDRFFFVGGEVKGPGRQPYISKMTVTKAIQSCGDFTDFANKKKVQLVRLDGRKATINCIKALRDPRLDLEVLPGDKIHVPRRFW